MSEVHKSIYNNALGNSQADRKLFLERFDTDYKPTIKTEHDFNIGQRPPEDAINRSKERIKQVESKEIDGAHAIQAGSQDDINT